MEQEKDKIETLVNSKKESLPPPPPPRNKKRRLYLIIGIAATVFWVVVIFWYINYTESYESTDDAFIDGYVTLLSPRVPGQVTKLLVTDNQYIKEGDVLVEIDPRDYETALSQAKAVVAIAHSQLNHAQAEVLVSEAKVDQAQAAVTVAEAQDKKANNDLGRYESVEARAVSKIDFDQAQAQALAADANLDSAHAQVKAAQADVSLSRADIESASADLAEAQAKLGQAQLNFSYTKIIAPRDGRITARNVQLGNYVQAGQTLLVIVPRDVWVVANFKETQLVHMRPGQPVELTLDAYPGRKFKGKIDSLQAGSGARFSLLPPENAVGNYVKVVQRIPVKIIFDDPLPDDLDIAPGMSVNPQVKVK